MIALMIMRNLSEKKRAAVARNGTTDESETLTRPNNRNGNLLIFRYLSYDCTKVTKNFSRWGEGGGGAGNSAPVNFILPMVEVIRSSGELKSAPTLRLVGTNTLNFG